MADATSADVYQEMYTRSFRHLAQQDESRLLRTARPIPEFGTGETFNYQRIGQTQGQEMVGRAPPSPENNTPMDRRVGHRYKKNWGEFVDRADIRRMVTDPTSDLLIEANNWRKRELDKNFIRALGDDLQERTYDPATGLYAYTTVSLPASQKIAGDSVGLTIDKLIEAREMLRKNEVRSGLGLVCLISAAQISDLLRITEVASMDFNSKKPLVDGEVWRFMGMDFIQTELLDKTGNDRVCFAYTTRALVYGSDPNATVTRLSERADRSHSMYAYLEFELGSLRTEEEHVVQITCVES